MAGKIPEEELIQQLKARNPEAFSYLYDHYAPALMGVIQSIIPLKDDAENLLQDAFIKIWKYIDRFDPEKGRLYTWLLTICRNTALNDLRSRPKILQLDIQDGLGSVYEKKNFWEESSVENIGIKDVVNKLDEKHQVIIDLLYYHGYTQQEVSDALQIPLGTVKTRTRSALQILKTRLT